VKREHRWRDAQGGQWRAVAEAGQPSKIESRVGEDGDWIFWAGADVADEVLILAGKLEDLFERPRLLTLGRPIEIQGREFFAAGAQPLEDAAGSWVLVLMPPKSQFGISDRISSLGPASERDLLDEALASLTVLSTRYDKERGDHFYATNRALAELGHIQEIRFPQPAGRSASRRRRVAS